MVDCQRSTFARHGRWTDELGVARSAALDAGELIVHDRRRLARRRGTHDVIAQADERSEALIMRRLGEAFPLDDRVGEETGFHRGRAPRSGRTWLVDPLDGTVNFASGIPFFAVSIALVEMSRVVVGVVRDPTRDEVFFGTRDEGGRHEPGGQRLQTRSLRRSADAVVTADPGDPVTSTALAVADVANRVRATRVLGSTALSLAWLAVGRLDGVLQVRGLQAIDVAAGALLAELAGARVSGADGGAWMDWDRLTLRCGIAAGRAGVVRLLVPPPRR